MQSIQFNIEGMTCQGCVNSVQQALSAVEGVQSVAVDLAQKTATVDCADDTVQRQQLVQAIEDAGFDVV